MNYDDLFPSKYLKGADFLQPKILTIRAVAVEEVGQENQQKPIVYFNEVARGLVLNKTNGDLIVHSYGKQTDGWLNRLLELRSEPVSFQGKIVDAIRVRTAAQRSVAPPTQIAEPATSPVPDSFVDVDIDF